MWNRLPAKNTLFSFQKSAFHTDKLKATGEIEENESSVRRDQVPIDETQLYQLILALNEIMNDFANQIREIPISPEL